MEATFDPQKRPDCTKIANVRLDHRSRHQMTRILRDDWDFKRDERKFAARCIEGNLKRLSAETLELIGAGVGPKREKGTEKGGEKRRQAGAPHAKARRRKEM